MADNLVTNPGAGGAIIATDEISNVHHPLSKIEFGADGQATMVSTVNPLPTTVAANVAVLLNDAFEAYTPSAIWNETKASSDLIFLDGNTAASSYLVISKSPLDAGTESVIETVASFKMPFEVSVGLSMSQRTMGQEVAIEIVDSTTLPDFSEVAITVAAQSASVLTVTTATPHGLMPGMAIGIRGVPDSRANYAACVVNTITAPTQFTVTTNTAGTIPSQTISTNNTSGFVYFRPRVSKRANGVSQIFENTVATNASFYVRTEGGDALPSGGVNTTHAATINTTASTQLVATGYTRAFVPTSEYRLSLQPERLQWFDATVDGLGQPNARSTRTQVLPHHLKEYKLRIRSTNLKSMTVPIAQITSCVRSASTTVTFTTDVAHGLSVADLVNVYGMRDATNFPAQGTATAVLSVPTSTTFTASFTPSGTATSFGGFVTRVQGGATQSSMGAPGIAIQTATLSSGILTLIGSASWTGITFGDLINVVGARIADGSSLGIDGAWRVRNFSTTTLELEPIGWTPPVDFTITNCGGAIIKRTDVRISFARIFDFDKMRVENSLRGSSDGYGSQIVSVVNSVNLATNSLVNLQIPTLITDITSGAITATSTAAAITPALGTAYEVNMVVTGVTGTNPTYDLSIEESDDSGTNWYRVYDFPRITANGSYRSPTLPTFGNRIRYVHTIGGTTPSFTRSINRLTVNRSTTPVRQFIDRTIAVNTINSVTPTYEIRDSGFSKLMLLVAMSAITTTAPSIQLEGSDDNGLNWYAIGTPVVGVANSVVALLAPEFLPGQVRARVSGAGVGATLNYILIKAYG